MRFFRFLFMLLIFSFVSNDTSSQYSKDSIEYSRYPFINLKENIICNQKELYPFIDKLFQLENTHKGNVTILHIGDSHIQADFFSGKIREFFQVNYGNAGRGLVFPYKAANSNDAYDITSMASDHWQNKRIIQTENPIPIGISGFTLSSNKTFSEIQIGINSKRLKYEFNCIKIFHDKFENSFDFVLLDKNRHKIGYINASDIEANPFVSTLRLDKMHQSLILQTIKTNETQQGTNFYGIIFENNYPGVLYHTIAANGAFVHHYLEAKYFKEQVKAINADLIIISLGTNESLNPPFIGKHFKMQLEQFTKILKETNPNASIIFTTPPDSYQKKKFKNKTTQLVQESIIDYCKQNNYAYWDLYTIMGAFASFDKWEQNGLAQSDKIHYTAKGYYIQADLFIKSLIKTFNNWKQ